MKGKILICFGVLTFMVVAFMIWKNSRNRFRIERVIDYNGNVVGTESYYLKNGDTIYHGSQSRLYLNGNLKESINLEHGEMQGTAYSFYENGEKERSCQFENGVMHGSYYKYFEDGKVREEGTYSNGDACSYWMEFNQNGDTLQLIDKGYK